jgi:hypothetical protein
MASTEGPSAALKERLALLQQQQRTLRSNAALKDDVLEQLQRAALEQPRALESEEEKITNVIMKRMDAFQAEHRKLAGSLKAEESGKHDLEAKLSRLTEDNDALRGAMRHEEDDIVARLKSQIAAMADRKRELEGRLQNEAVAMHVNEMVASAGPGAAPVFTGAAHSDPAEVAELLASDDVAAASPTVRNRHNMLASDTSMLSVLQREIDRLQTLQGEVAERTQEYEEQSKLLGLKISAAQADRERDRDRAEFVRSELDRTVTLTAELAANSEVLSEWATDKELFLRASSVHSESLCQSDAGEREGDSSVESAMRVTPTGEAYRPHVLHGRPVQHAGAPKPKTTPGKK